MLYLSHGGGEAGLSLGEVVSVLAGEEGLAVFVEVELGDDHVRGLDADHLGLASLVLAGGALNVDDPLAAVHAGDLALDLAEATGDDADLVVLADRDGTDVVLVSELLRQRGAHADSALHRVGLEKVLASLGRLR